MAIFSWLTQKLNGVESVVDSSKIKFSSNMSETESVYDEISDLKSDIASKGVTFIGQISTSSTTSPVASDFGIDTTQFDAIMVIGERYNNPSSAMMVPKRVWSNSVDSNNYVNTQFYMANQQVSINVWHTSATSITAQASVSMSYLNAQIYGVKL